MNTSAVRASAQTAVEPSGVRMSSASDRLPALSAAKPAGVSAVAASPGTRLARITSPPCGDSIFMTSAPSWAR